MKKEALELRLCDVWHCDRIGYPVLSNEPGAQIIQKPSLIISVKDLGVGMGRHSIQGNSGPVAGDSHELGSLINTPTHTGPYRHHTFGPTQGR